MDRFRLNPALSRIGFDFVWRLPVPAELSPRCHRTALSQPLYTGERTVADATSRLLTRQADRLFRWLADNAKADSRDVELACRRFDRWADALAAGIARSSRSLAPPHLPPAPQLPYVGEAARPGREEPLRFSEVFERFEAERLAYAQQTTRVAKGVIARDFIALIGDLPIDEITRADVVAYKDHLVNRPARLRNHKPERRQVLLAEPGAARLSPETVNSYLRHLVGLFRWAVSNGLIAKNPAEGLYVGDRRRVRGRHGFDRAELECLFVSGPLYAGSCNHFNRLTPGQTVVRDHLYWLPLIALYSGLRAGEAAGLEVADVCEEAGVVCLLVRTNGVRRIKTAASERVVPLHPVLLRLGLRERAAALAQAGESRLFPEAKANARGDITSGISRFWTRYRRSQGVDGARQSFHALRHTFITELKHRGAAAEVIAELAGHTPRGVTFRNYGHHYRPDQLLEAIRLIDFGLTHPGMERSAPHGTAPRRKKEKKPKGKHKGKHKAKRGRR